MVRSWSRRRSQRPWPPVGRVLAWAIAIVVGWMGFGGWVMSSETTPIAASARPIETPQLLTDPFLQAPGPDSVRVVWFTEFAGDRHQVAWGDRLQHRALANSTRLSHTREDGRSNLPPAVAARQPEGTTVWARPIWRHEAIVTGLEPGQRVPYRVASWLGDRIVESQTFTLAAQAPPGQPLRILLTSDHQLKPMVAANLQQVATTVGAIDAVLLAGDLVNVPDRASEWFDDAMGGAFFPCLQGRAARSLHGTVYRGGALIQHAPLFTALGNHEVMGRLGQATDLNGEFNDAIPRWAAQQLAGDRPLSVTELVDRSFNTRTYDQILTPPGAAGRHYYATSLGDVRLVVLSVAQAWRSPMLTGDRPGRFREGQPADPQSWGWGQHIFESIAPGSPQDQWLQAELASPAFRQARYRVVMLHHPPHTLGDNSVPPFTDPVQAIDRDAKGQITAVRYSYPRDRDWIAQHLSPLLEAAGTDLVLYGHSHLWNRFQTGRTHYLETSNVGNSYGAAWGDRPRSGLPPAGSGFDRPDYVPLGDPNGLEPIAPTLAPDRDPATGEPLPYLASNEISAFSILDTATGTVTSYRVDPRQPDRPAEPFDRFTLGRS